MSTEEYGIEELERDYGPFTFGRSLCAVRKGEEMTLKEFALKLGISSQSLCDIEKGRRIPSVSRAAKIARQIGQFESFWIELALQDMLRKEQLNYKVSVA